MLDIVSFTLLVCFFHDLIWITATKKYDWLVCGIDPFRKQHYTNVLTNDNQQNIYDRIKMLKIYF